MRRAVERWRGRQRLEAIAGPVAVGQVHDRLQLGRQAGPDAPASQAEPLPTVHDRRLGADAGAHRYGDVNPSITDSSTFTFLTPEKMKEAFDHELEGRFLYSGHWNPINKYLSRDDQPRSARSAGR